MIDHSDNQRNEPEELYARFLRAKIQLYQVIMETCPDIRSQIEEAGTDETLRAEQYAQRIAISCTQLDQTGELVLGLEIEICKTKETTDSPNARTTRYESQWSELLQSAVRRVMKKIDPSLRQALADYITDDIQRQMVSSLEETGRYDEIDELYNNFNTLYQNIINGSFPTPPPPWGGVQNPPL